GLPEPPDDLKRGVGLARSGGHRQQQAVLPFRDRFNRTVDGAGLVVPRPLAAAVVEVILENDRLRFWRKSLPDSVPRPQRRGRWELVELKVLLDCPARRGAIVEDEPVAVR